MSLFLVNEWVYDLGRGGNLKGILFFHPKHTLERSRAFRWPTTWDLKALEAI
jgi:hypothetical protein